MESIRLLAYGSVLSTYILIVVGGYVSATGSGLACPDWPLCNGQVIPELSGPVLIEYTHRLLALLVSVFVIGTAIVTWTRHRSNRKLILLSTASVVMLASQILLGMVTVASRLEDIVSTAHLALATGVFGFVLATATRVTVQTRPQAKFV